MRERGNSYFNFNFFNKKYLILRIVTIFILKIGSEVTFQTSKNQEG